MDLFCSYGGGQTVELFFIHGGGQTRILELFCSHGGQIVESWKSSVVMVDRL